MVIGGGGGNRSNISTPGLDDPRMVSGTGIREDAVKKDGQSALEGNLVTMSQIPDVNQELVTRFPSNAIYEATGKRIRTLPIGDQLRA